MYEIERDSAGGLILVPAGLGGCFIIPIIFCIIGIVGGAILVAFMEKIYAMGEVISWIFAITSILVIIEKALKRNTRFSFFYVLHGLIIAPAFSMFLYAGLTYWTTWADNLTSAGGQILFLLYIFLGPIISLIMGISIAVFLAKLSTFIFPEKKASY